jgi:co-chaperonin GroES (HSP10)
MTKTLLAPVDRVIVKEITVEKKTTGGIILTESAGDPNNTARKGEIVSSGFSKDGLEVGTVVYFGKHSGNTIQHEDEIYVSLVQHDIVGVVV